MFCRNCGKNLKLEEKFCGNCGIKVENRNIQQYNQYVNNNLINGKKDSKVNLFVGIILTIIGIAMTILTFFFFGPFLGFMFLIPGTTLLFNSIFSQSKKGIKILLTIVVCVITIIISVLFWQRVN